MGKTEESRSHRKSRQSLSATKKKLVEIGTDGEVVAERESVNYL
jgi:hypothetical protein